MFTRSCKKFLKWVSDQAQQHVLFCGSYYNFVRGWIWATLLLVDAESASTWDGSHHLWAAVREMSPSVLPPCSSVLCSLDGEGAVFKTGASALVRCVFVLPTDGWQSPPEPSASSSEAANTQADSSRRREWFLTAAVTLTVTACCSQSLRIVCSSRLYCVHGDQKKTAIIGRRKTVKQKELNVTFFLN